MDFPRFRLHPALLTATRTSRIRQPCRRHFSRPLTLRQPAETLPQRMRVQLNLIVVRRPCPLLHPLQLRCYRRRLLQQISQLLLQPFLIRIHAI